MIKLIAILYATSVALILMALHFHASWLQGLGAFIIGYAMLFSWIEYYHIHKDRIKSLKQYGYYLPNKML